MRAGLRRNYVTIQRNTPTQGASGEEIDVWSNLSNEWAFIRAVDGEESINTLKVNIRNTDVLHTDRILFGSRVFDIVSVVDRLGFGRDLELIVKEDLDA